MGIEEQADGGIDRDELLKQVQLQGFFLSEGWGRQKYRWIWVSCVGCRPS